MAGGKKRKGEAKDDAVRVDVKTANRLQKKQERRAAKRNQCPMRDWGMYVPRDWCGGCDVNCGGKGGQPVTIRGYVRDDFAHTRVPPSATTPPASGPMPLTMCKESWCGTCSRSEKVEVTKVEVPPKPAAKPIEPVPPKCVMCKTKTESWHEGASDDNGKVACLRCYLDFCAKFARDNGAKFPGLDDTQKQGYDRPGQDLDGGWSDL